MKYNSNCYLYKVLKYELRNCFLVTRDIQSFMHISCQLREQTCSHTELSMNCKECKTAKFVPIEEQLIDFMDNYPDHTEQLMKVR